ncbi:MAG: cation transporter [Sterolibacterium sp.]
MRERQGKTLRIVLAINAVLFLTEFGAGLVANSTSLMADSLDSLGDALVYAVSLYVLSRNDLWRAGAAMLKGVIMLGFGIAVTIAVLAKFSSPVVPVAELIGVFGLFALACNASCLYLLTRHSSDDLNMESVWLCSRNDIVANVGVLLAGAGVALTGSMWPDLLVGAIIAILFLKSALYVISKAWGEIRANPKAHVGL